MQTLIQVINHYSKEKINTQSARDIIHRLIADEKIKAREIALIFVDDEYLRKLHRQFLKDDTYTDVMAFNLNEGGEVEGEIYISIDRVKLHMREFRVAETEEIARLIIHGLLHFKGYTDETPSQRQKMREKENYYLNQYQAIIPQLMGR